jgi:hypothetical protein
MWLKTFYGGYVNGDQVYRLDPAEVSSGGNWKITLVYASGNPSGVDLSGEWATAAEAEDAIRRLVHGTEAT